MFYALRCVMTSHGPLYLAFLYWQDPPVSLYGMVKGAFLISIRNSFLGAWSPPLDFRNSPPFKEPQESLRFPQKLASVTVSWAQWIVCSSYAPLSENAFLFQNRGSWLKGSQFWRLFLGILCRISEDTNYPDWRYSWFSAFPPGKRWDTF